MEFPYSNTILRDISDFKMKNDFYGQAVMHQPLVPETQWGTHAKATLKTGRISLGQQFPKLCSYASDRHFVDADESVSTVYVSDEEESAMGSPSLADIPSPAFSAMPCRGQPQLGGSPYAAALPWQRAPASVSDKGYGSVDASPFLDTIEDHGTPYDSPTKPGGGYGFLNPRDVCECGTALILDFRFCAGCGRQRPESTSGLARRPAAPTHAFNSVSQSLPTCPPGLPHPEAVPEPCENQGEVTTLMVCDIPCTRTIEQVAAAMDSIGFAQTYDLIYMPKSPKQRGRRSVAQVRNVGYAFVNFKQPEYAAKFMMVFRDFQWSGTSSQKLSYAKPAHFQGFEANFQMQLSSATPGPILTFRDEITTGQTLRL